MTAQVSVCPRYEAVTVDEPAAIPVTNPADTVALVGSEETQDASAVAEWDIDLTIQEPATYTGQCAEFCGLLHDRMVFSIRAVSGPEFDAWLSDQEPGS